MNRAFLRMHCERREKMTNLSRIDSIFAKELSTINLNRLRRTLFRVQRKNAGNVGIAEAF